MKFHFLACTLISAHALGAPFTADLVEATPAPAAPSASVVSTAPLTITRIFEQACVRTEGQTAQAIDWALAHEFEPVATERGSMETLLEGKPGTVLAAPKTDGSIMLAVADHGCSVWAEQTSGPPIRQAVNAWMAHQTSGKAQRLLDRKLSKAGAWRQQMAWRYRPTGAAQDFNIGLVTTMTERPGTQVLRWAPATVAPASAYQPDGMPVEH